MEFQNNDNSNIDLPQKENSKPPYLLGLLGFIPIFGFFVGIGLTFYGLLKYRDKKLVFIGVFCMLFTLFVYSFLYFGLQKFSKVKESWVELSQYQINELVKDIEYYKLQNDKYPDSLKQIVGKGEFVNIQDPVKGLKATEKDIFIYKNLGNKNLLYSVGLDDIRNTKDDIYPKVEINSKIGWVKTP